jgi:hypothetical protein
VPLYVNRSFTATNNGVATRPEPVQSGRWHRDAQHRHVPLQERLDEILPPLVTPLLPLAQLPGQRRLADLVRSLGLPAAD